MTVLPRHRKVILLHGCFWHRHGCPLGRPTPATRRAFWREKLEGNRRRDAAQRRRLRRAGWRVLVVWQCETAPARRAALARRLARFLRPEEAGGERG